MQAYSRLGRDSRGRFSTIGEGLPDVEVFYHQHAKRELIALNAGDKALLYGECVLDEEGDCRGSGWYYWYCYPGCLPDSDPYGPFKTAEAALAEARKE